MVRDFSSTLSVTRPPFRCLVLAAVLLGGASSLRPKFGKEEIERLTKKLLDDEVRDVHNKAHEQATSHDRVLPFTLSMPVIMGPVNAASAHPMVGALPLVHWIDGDATTLTNGHQPKYRLSTWADRDSQELLDARAADHANPEDPPSWRDVLMALGSGSGFYTDPRDRSLHAQQVLRELRYQHLAASLLIVVVFCGFLATSLSMVYWQVQAQVREMASVRYYARLGHDIACADGVDVQGFLDAFDKPPSSARLTVSGWELVDHEPSIFFDSDHLFWNGGNYRVAFSFALDLTPWLEPTTMTDASSLEQAGSASVGGVGSEDRSALRRFLRRETNDLATVELHKTVIWADWEDLATNIKLRLREQGFTGVVHVRCEGDESITVLRNSSWAHFMRARATRAIAALSIVGWGFYELYMWIRVRKLVLRSKHHINVPIQQYWRLVGDKLTVDGFNAPGMVGGIQAPPGHLGHLVAQ